MKSNINLPYDLAALLLNIYPREITACYIHTKFFRWLFKLAFLVTETNKQLKSLHYKENKLSL